MMEHKIMVRYADSKNMETVSPVFDAVHVPIPMPGLSPNSMRLTVEGFFLVYENQAGKKLVYKGIRECEIVEILSNRNAGIKDLI